MSIRTLATVLTALWMPALSVVAQRGPAQVTVPRPGWLARDVLTATQPGTAADRATVEANLAAAEALIAKVSGYATPRGFEITPWWQAATISARDRIAGYGLMIRVHNQSKVAAAGGWSPSVSIGFNSLGGIAEPAQLQDEDGKTIFIERQASALVHGATAAYGTYSETEDVSLTLLFTSRGQSPVLPVSREEYLKGLIVEAEGKNGEERKRQLEIAKGPTPYEEWVSGAAERKKEREEMFAAMSDKAQAAKMRADLEKVERETTELMKKNEPLHREMLGRFAQPGAGDTWRAEIAAMTPEERASTAMVAGVALVPAATPGAKRVVRLNPAFSRARGSPVEPRVISVTLRTSYKSADVAMRQLYKELDWDALKQMLDQRP
jgi:hypothetical protein